MSNSNQIGDYTHFNDFRDLLRSEYKIRQQNNSKYTLGAFARHLGLKTSHVHEILNARYGISRALAEKIAEKLKFSEHKTHYFCDLVESQHGRSEINKKLALLRLVELKQRSQFNKLSLDSFNALSDWYHFAILELTYLEGFVSDYNWIAKKLNLTLKTVKQAVSRLMRLGLLVEKDKQWSASMDYSLVGGEMPSSAIKSYHLQLLKKSQMALLDQPLPEREFTSLTLSVDKSRIPEAKAMIQEFQHRFCKTMNDSAKKDGVYCLSIQLFNLEEKNHEKN